MLTRLGLIREFGLNYGFATHTLNTEEKQQLQFEVLSDGGNKVAPWYGIVMDVPTIVLPINLQWRLDVPAASGDDTRELPIPATHVVDGDGRIGAADVNKYYTRRMRPADIVAALRSLTN